MTMCGATALSSFTATPAWAKIGRGVMAVMLERELAESASEHLHVGSELSWAQAEALHSIGAKTRALRAALIRIERNVRARGDRINPWPKDADSVDYRHLLALGRPSRYSRRTFTLNHGVLQKLAQANGYDGRLAESAKVAFGLRGCQIVEAGSGPQPTVRLREARPNHVDRRCVIGVWDRFNATVAVYEGSTVPSRIHLELHRAQPNQWPCHLLPQGLHEFVGGTHLERAPAHLRQPGALLQAKACPVLRPRGDLALTHQGSWDAAVRPIGNAIHASVYLTDFIKFSSQGAQTVYGRYWPQGRRPTGPWAYFRAALGLEDVDLAAQNSPSDGQTFPYLLCTGREARLHATGARDPSPMRRVRYGTWGAHAEQAQTALRRLGLLKSPVDGKFGRDSMVALLALQKRRRQPRDAVITPTLAQQLKLKDW